MGVSGPNGTERVIVFGAHPDDAEIGAGGTIAAYAGRGHRVIMVNFRVPGGHDDSCHDTRERRRAEAGHAAAALGAELLSFGLSRDGIHATATLVGTIDKLLAEIDPTAVFTHWLGDSHPEHISLSRAVLAATRRNRCSVYMYEATLPGGISAHSFRAQKFIDISDTIDAKMASLTAYRTQLERYGEQWLEAIRGRAAHRGFQMGRRYAEAFQVVKELSQIPYAANGGIASSR
jgi:LmbE family N-acetylglucosaminyl deacetylase